MCILSAPRLLYSFSQYLQLKYVLLLHSHWSCLCLAKPMNKCSLWQSEHSNLSWLLQLEGTSGKIVSRSKVGGWRSPFSCCHLKHVGHRGSFQQRIEQNFLGRSLNNCLKREVWAYLKKMEAEIVFWGDKSRRRRRWSWVPFGAVHLAQDSVGEGKWCCAAKNLHRYHSVALKNTRKQGETWWLTAKLLGFEQPDELKGSITVSQPYRRLATNDSTKSTTEILSQDWFSYFWTISYGVFFLLKTYQCSEGCHRKATSDISSTWIV